MTDYQVLIHDASSEKPIKPAFVALPEPGTRLNSRIFPKVRADEWENGSRYFHSGSIDLSTCLPLPVWDD